MNDAEEAFEEAWNHPDYTQIKLDDVNINQRLKQYYVTDNPVHFTRTMLWDMGVKKAWDPATYLAYVVRSGASWDREKLFNGDECFSRSTEQKQWLDPESYEEVLEEIYLNHKEQKATFLGVPSLRGSDDEILEPPHHQSLFYVQQSVLGEEDNPIHAWRIVHLTDGKDESLLEFFKKCSDPTVVPGFVKIYIEKDLGVVLSSI